MHVYFLGIAGAGMSALASMLQSRGDRVSGSDSGVFPPISTYLQKIGVPYRDGFDPANIAPDVEAAILGASAKLGGAENPEAAALAQRGIATASFPEFLGDLTAERENILVAGSFGKSTLAAMLAITLREAGRDPGYFIGAVPLDLDRTGWWGASPEMVLEADEYVISPEDRRSKFEVYCARHTLITSLVHDHVNMFPTMADYEAPFARLITATPAGGKLVCARNYEPLARLTAGRAVVWYGLGEGPGFCALDVQPGAVTRFVLRTPEGESFPVETELLGLHNVENICAAAAMLLSLGLVTPRDVQAAARKFRGVARRLDKKTTHSRVAAYEGFGSSYEKARSAIEAIELHFPQARRIVVFEPHTFSWRSAETLSWYDTVFEGVAEVLLLPPPTHGATTHQQLSHAAIAERMRAAGVAVTPCADAEAVRAALAAKLSGDEVILLLSSGPLDGLADSLPPWLEARFPEAAARAAGHG